ncbi:hypothetical protein IFT84_02745 [Rhizobium sp. CFBP 8762]|uniref:hypothetical protein n=1 Tax=Rhizobium sp. CFBP 8762 TaxID=2775279 RepID=UPI00177DF516|nr:hypothetical protein [Rhizobium sp. CFBP 8762]MBD8553438.1 hypothetical protein [Rhizobium sp. CFBP 8762]
MLKLLFTGVWVCAISLGAVYFSSRIPAKPLVLEGAAAKRAGEQYVFGELTTLPVIQNGAVQGYFLTKITLIVKRDAIEGLDIPIKETLTDELYSLLVGNKVIDITNTKAFDLNDFKKMILETMNTKLAGDIVQTVLVEQLEYLTKQDVTLLNNPQRMQRQPVPIVDGKGQKGNDIIPSIDKAAGE